MIRIFFTYLLPLLLPMAVYFMFMLPAQRRAVAQGREASWEKTPWVLLAAAGVSLLGLTLGMLALHDGEPPWSHYDPPHMEDGHIMPGQFSGTASVESPVSASGESPGSALVPKE
jgi:hypothetical protein